MNEAIKKLKAIDAEKTKKAFIDLLKAYLQPAYGSMSKRDFDILLFMKLQELGVFSKNPEIYDLITQLRVSRGKARNLLYESKLRQSSSEELDRELKYILINPIFSKQENKICLEIDNPFLKDHLRAKLKELRFTTDGSFSKEIITLSMEAYATLFESFLSDEIQKETKEKLTTQGILRDTSLTNLIKEIIKNLLVKYTQDSGNQLIEEHLSPLLKGKIDLFINKLNTLNLFKK